MSQTVKLEGAASILWPLSIATAAVAGWYLAPGAVKLSVGALTAGLILVRGYWSPVFGLAALLIITPFQPFIDFYAPSLASLYAGAVLRDGLLVAITLAWVFRRVLPRKPLRELLLTEKLALAYLGVLAVWVIPAPVFVGGLVGYRNLAGFLMLLVVASEVGASRQRRDLLLRVFLVAAFCSAIVGIAEFLTNREVFDLMHYDISAAVGPDLAASYGTLPRASGGIGNPLVYGFYMAIAATLSAAFLGGKGPFPRWYLWLVLLSTSLATVLTLSRSAFIALAVGVLGTGLMLRPRRVWIWVLLLALVIVVANYTPAGEILTDRLTFSDRAGIETATERWDIWKMVLSSRSSLLGEGLGTQGGALGRSGSAPNTEFKLGMTDNYYGDMLMQVGVIPLLVFLAFLAALAKSVYRYFRTAARGQDWALAAASFMLVVMIVLESASSSSLESRAVTVALWTLLGSAASLTSPQLESSAGGTRLVPEAAKQDLATNISSEL
jgi:hypothetical protein